MSLSVSLTIYCLLVVAASLLGGYLPSRFVLSHRRLQMIVSAVAGLMLGVALLHLIPHAAAHSSSLDRTMLWTLVGVVGTFFLMRAFHSHQHSIDLPRQPEDAHHACEQGHAHGPDHAHSHEHTHSHGHHHGSSGGSSSWIGIAIGLSIHTLIDGIALGAAVAADQHRDGWSGIAGLGTFLAVALHKPLDSLSITSLMLAQGWSARARLVVNLTYSLMCPIGAALFLFGVSESANAGGLIAAALAFSGGVFLCISLADLLPEIEFHSHDRLKLSGALILGTVLAYGIGFLEPNHHHDGSNSEHHHGHDHSHNHDDHSHDGHDHGTPRKQGPVFVSPD
jgi:zinc and cadmium transporter